MLNVRLRTRSPAMDVPSVPDVLVGYRLYGDGFTTVGDRTSAYGGDEADLVLTHEPCILPYPRIRPVGYDTAEILFDRILVSETIHIAFYPLSFWCVSRA